MSKVLNFKLKNAPKKPGAYIFRNSENEIIYIGKAKNLSKRVNSYFRKSHQDKKTSRLVSKISFVDFMVTDNEVEALILEINLIKKHRPVFNIDFKDDKSYPYISVTLEDKFPRIAITREAHKKGVKYFGPYVNTTALRQTVDTLRSIFPLRTCRGVNPGRKSHRQIKKGMVTYSPCLNFHIERCAAPCSKKISADKYKEIVAQVIDFIEGRGKKTLSNLKGRMKDAAGKQQFEKAARIRDRFVAAKTILDKQKVESGAGDDLDIFGLSAKDGYFSVAIFMVRNGKLIGSENIELKENAEPEPLLSFIKHYYHTTSYIPKEVIVAQDISDASTLEDWLSNIKKGSVRINKPQRGRKKRLVELATKNAKHNLDFYLKRLQVENERQMKALKQLKDSLNIKMPYRIESFDVSNIAGASAVGSMVVFENGKAKKSHYRKFKILFDEGIDDYKMLAEVLERRLKNLSKANGDSFKVKPDLILIDGGKGQLSVTKAVLDHYFGDVSINGTVPDIASLAKKEEELFIPGASKSIRLPQDSFAYRLVQEIRDEAHRFAIQYHRNLRSKRMLTSVLDEIKGIGKERKKLILKSFGSVQQIKKLSSEKLSEETGLSESLSQKIIKHLA